MRTYTIRNSSGTISRAFSAASESEAVDTFNLVAVFSMEDIILTCVDKRRVGHTHQVAITDNGRIFYQGEFNPIH